MLRRKILTSAMASVMALTSVSVVAFADDTATDVKNVKTKADLEAYVKSFDSFREKEINDYGSISGERFLSAIEYADNVLESSTSPDDYTVAYKMLETVYNSLKQYNASDLRDLIKSCESIYNTDNILNEDLQDAIYSDESFADFASAFDSAEIYVTSSDSRLITDAYEELAEAKSNLSALPSVTKSAFRTALKNYEKMVADAEKYDTWRRGNLANGWIDNMSTWWVFGDAGAWGSTLEFDDLVDIVTGSGFSFAYSWGIVYALGAEGTTVEDLINDGYNALDEVKAVSKTTNEDIVNAYQQAVDAVSLFNAWTADDTNRASKSQVQKLLTTYHSQLVAKYQTTAAENLYLAVNANWVEQEDGSWAQVTTVPEGWQNADNKYFGASLTNEGTKAFEIFVDGDGFANYDEWGNTSDTKKQSVRAKTDLLQYINVTSADVIGDTYLKNAMDLAELYIGGDYASSDILSLDTSGTLGGKTPSGATAEWTIVYRYLKYALEDAFGGYDNTTYTRSQVSALMEDAYQLAEDTGDAAIFSDEHAALVAARQEANIWLRAANKDKTYKDGNLVEYTSNNVTSSATATQMYLILKAPYDALDAKLANYKYSYEEIYNAIADVSDMLDGGTLEANDTLTAALADTAYYLSILEPSNDDNEAFTADRQFVKYNRLYTDGNNQNAYEANLQAAYEALTTAVKAQTDPEGKLGDVNGDGAVNTLDAALILKATVDGTVDTLSNADFNADGVVNSLDAASILKAVVDGTV